MCGYDCVPREMSVATALVRAKRNLMMHVDVIGLTEDIPGFLNDLKETVPYLNGITLPTVVRIYLYSCSSIPRTHYHDCRDTCMDLDMNNKIRN